MIRDESINYMNIKLLFLCMCMSSLVYSQSIQEYYNFHWPESNKDTIIRKIVSDDISIYNFSFPKKSITNFVNMYYKEKYIFIYKDAILKDSLEYEARSFPSSEDEIIRTNSHIYFLCSTRIKDPSTRQESYKKQLVTIDKKKAKVIDLYSISDSIDWFLGRYENVFLYKIYREDRYYHLYAFSPETKTSKLLYDFTGKINAYYSIGDFIYLKGKNKLLVIAILGADGIDSAVYFSLDLKTLKLEEITDTNFTKLVEAPKKQFESSPYYQITIHCNPMYDYFYYDITDTLVYLNVHDYYGYFLNEKGDAKAGSATYPQDAFVLNGNYEVIDQVLNRERVLDNFSEGVIYKNEKKKWIMLDIETDSYATYSINFAIKYSLEKAFYNIYYNKELSDKDLQGFDQYELLLLKNFIYAKYNYKFKNPFYEAYYNTFTFYHDFQTWDAGKKKLERRKKVDKYFTKEDNKNLALILIKIK